MDANYGQLFGGVHSGYNFQSGAFVYGIEGDVEITASSGHKRTHEDFRGSLRARAGYSSGSALFYLTGGAAFRDRKVVISDIFGPVLSKQDFLTGYTLGVGAEYAFGKNWSARVEYRYSDFGSSSVNAPGRSRFPMICVGFGPCSSVWRFRDHDHAIRIGVSYHFGG